MIVCIFISSCDNNEPKKNSIYSVIDNVIYGNPLTIEIYDKDKISIKIDADTLHKYNEGNTLLFGRKSSHCGTVLDKSVLVWEFFI